MMMRLWRGRVPSGKAAAYLAFLREGGLKDYAETPGNLGIYAFQRELGPHTEFLLLTLWESVAAIKRFAGEEYEKARYKPEDNNFLIELEPLVAHYEVTHAAASTALRFEGREKK